MKAKAIKKHTLKFEISGVLVVKLIAIYLLWLICFSHPLDKLLTSQSVSQHLLGNSTVVINNNKHRRLGWMKWSPTFDLTFIQDLMLGFTAQPTRQSNIKILCLELDDIWNQRNGGYDLRSLPSCPCWIIHPTFIWDCIFCIESLVNYFADVSIGNVKLTF